MNKAFYEVETVKTRVEHKGPIIVWFIILQYAKHRMLELYYKFFTKFCDVNNLEEVEMDTYSLYVTPAEKELDCIQFEIKADWEQMRSKICNNCCTADAVGNYFPQMCCNKDKKLLANESLVFSKRNSGLGKSFVFVMKLTAPGKLSVTS